MTSERDDEQQRERRARAGGDAKHEEGAARLSVTVEAQAHVHHHLVTTEILRRARQAHLAGATVLPLTEKAPSKGPHLVLLVDEQERLGRFVTALSDLGGKLSCALEPVEVLSGSPARRESR